MVEHDSGIATCSRPQQLDGALRRKLLTPRALYAAGICYAARLPRGRRAVKPILLVG
jgi:hypothetical protein